MLKLNYLIVMPCSSVNSAGERIFPLGLAYLSSCLKKSGFCIHTLNLNNYNDYQVESVLEKSINDNHIDVVMTGGLSIHFSIIKRILEASVRVKSNIINIVGGGLITGDPVPAMSALELAHFGVIGEGEVTAQELCCVLESGGDYSSIKGIVYKNDSDNYVVTDARPVVVDIDELPFPDYEGFQFERHLPDSSINNNSVDIRRKLNSVYIIGSRSCPYKCTFCFHTVGNIYRQRTLDNIFSEIEYLVSKYQIRFLGIQDELFSTNRQRVLEFCRRIKPFGIGWWAQFRVDTIDRDLIDAVKDAGCQIIGFGLESADNRILKSMRKGITIEQIESALEIVYAAGVPFVGSFIFGDREESFETANNTLTWWKRHLKHRIDLRLIMVYPGSELYYYALQTGKISDPVRYLKDGCPQINVSKMTDQEFAVIAKAIVSAPIENPVEFKHPRYQYGVLYADCAACGHENNYEHVVFFMGSYLSCAACGQKHNMPLPAEILKKIESNLEILLKKHGKVAIWAINYYVNYLFDKLDVLKNINFYPIDSSSAKQGMLAGTRKIHCPDILDHEMIEVVIVGVPSYKLQIETHIREKYKHIIHVIDICDLIDNDLDFI